MKLRYRESIYLATTHPTLGMSILLLALFVFGSSYYRADLSWLLVSVTGLFLFHLGFTSASMIRSIDRLSRVALLVGESLTFIVLVVSFRMITPLFPLLAIIWVLVLNISAYVTAYQPRGFRFLSSLVYVAGSILTMHSFLQYGNWEVIRKMSLTPVEGAFGMFLIFISYPSLLQWLLDRSQLMAWTFIGLTCILMLLHGFRADVFLIILSTFVLLIRRRSPSAFTLLLVPLALFFGVEELRSYVKVPIFERIAFRLSTTYYYSKELCHNFLFLFPPYGPFWLSSIPLHPSQSLGRGIFGKAYGITPTIFVGMLIDLGLVGMWLLSFSLGMLSSYSYRLSMKMNRDPFSYNLIWPILITRVETGLDQLDLALIAGSVVFASLANLINGRDHT